MNKEETLALYNKGRDAWNAWAKEMLAQRDKLMETGQWVLDHPSANNLVTEGWITSALVDFSGHTFETGPDFSSFLFPGDAKFTKTKFAKEALRRLATQGHDYQRELNFLADEIKSLRGVEDKKWPSPTNLFKGSGFSFVHAPLPVASVRPLAAR